MGTVNLFPSISHRIEKLWVQTIGHIYLLQHLQDIQLLRFSPKIYKLESFESQILNIFVDYLNAYFLFAVTKRFFQDLNVGL